MTVCATISREQFTADMRAGGERARIAKEKLSLYRRFTPRPDNPAKHDFQTSFDRSNDRVSVGIGGTGSGKTACAAKKVARFVRETPPYRPHCPYWVISETYDMVCGVAWLEKLSKLIPESMILEIDWYKKTRQWPYAVMLKHPQIPGAVGWTLEFKSFKQGRERFQAASIGGAWFNEQAPLDLVDEVKGRTRDYNSQLILDFTPLKPDIDWPGRFENPPPGWKFFTLNSECNDALPPGWVDEFLAGIPEEYRDTRRLGTFASFRGAVFKDFRREMHVVEPFEIPKYARRIRGIDFGYTAPFVCIRWARMPYSVPLPDGRIAQEGTWVAYHEHVKAETLLHDHAMAIKSVEPWDHTNNPNEYGPTVADHDSQDAAELRACGVSTIPADKGENSVEIGLYAMKKLMIPSRDPTLYAPKFLVMSNCKTLIKELQAYRYDEGTDNRDSRGVPVKKDDHAIDASRYCLVEGLHRAGEFPTEALDIGKRPVWRESSKDFLGAK